MQLYNEVPESTFTRTVSNPEAVMKKRREQKLQRRGGDRLCKRKIYRAHSFSLLFNIKSAFVKIILG